MSASREKKQRQGSTDTNLSNKQRRELEEAAKARNKGILYAVLGVVTAVLVIALLLWHSGVFEKNKVVASVDGQDYTITDFGYYYYPSHNYMANLFGGTVDEETKASIRAQALDSLHQYASLYAAATKDGYTVTDDIQAQVESSIEQIQTYAAQNNTTFAVYVHSTYGPYMTEKLLRENLTRQAVATTYYSDHKDTLAFDDAQLDAYYQEHTDELDSFIYSAAFINGAAASSTDADGNTVAATDAEKATAMSLAKATSDDLLKQVQAGGDFDTLGEEFAARDENSSFQAESTILGSSLTNALNDDCNAWLTDAARKSGDTTTIEVADKGYWVLQFQNRFLDEDGYGTVDVRHILIKAELAGDDTTPTQDALDAAKATAEDLLARWEAGDKTADSFGALATEFSEDPGSKDNGGLYTTVARNQFFTAFNDWMFDTSRQVGDTTLIENPQSGQQGWHVVYLEKQGDLQWQYTARNTLSTDTMSAWLEELEGTYPITANDANMAIVG